MPRRAPHGARGLKRQDSKKEGNGIRRAPHGARGLKLEIEKPILTALVGRAPHGARGLKPCAYNLARYLYRSRPARGAWIETSTTSPAYAGRKVAPRTGRVD